MTSKAVKNVAASVLARLRNKAKAGKTTFQQVLQQYAIERFLYRISKSAHAQTVILKGALLLKTIGIPNARPTLDIDFLRAGRADKATLMSLVKDCAMLEVDSDGLVYLAETIEAEEISKDSEYKGVRILVDARIDKVRLKIQIDFGVGDVIVPGPQWIEYPAVLDDSAIRLLAYPVESAIAEKLQAMIALGNANSRMKDFYDIWICSRYLEFDGETIQKAIAATLKNRETPIPAGEIEALTKSFSENHLIQWNAFVKKIGEDELTNSLDDILSDLARFVVPLLVALAHGEKWKQTWTARSGWVAK